MYILIMKRQVFDASNYTDYIKKRTNTALVQSGNFKNKKSITSTPPSYLDVLKPSLQQEYETPIVIQQVSPEPPPSPPIPSVVTIIDDIPINYIEPTLGGAINLNSEITIRWSCIPESEVRLQLYGATYDSSYSINGQYMLLETIITRATSHTFNVTGYGFMVVDDVAQLGTRAYIVITPTIGEPAIGRQVGLLGPFF